jgi:iron(III) transport system permease protein
MAVAMFDQWSNGQSGEASALGMVWTCVMTLFASLFYYVSEHQSNPEKST